MNKTLSVNIGGYIFNIEEDAYALLRDYLDAISSYFAGHEGSDEIIIDIEARIAELFNERLGEDRQVVLNTDVDEVITIMGKPEQYAEAEANEETNAGAADSKKSKKSRSTDNRRFYRDDENSIIGGVAAGFSHYFGWDPLILRAIFILLAFTSIGIPLYLILWVLIPAAVTTAEKLKMKGEKINVENISKKINEEMDNVKSKFSNENKKEASKSINKLVSGIGEFFSLLANVFRGFLGVIFLFLGIGMLVGITVLIGGFSSGVPGAGEFSFSFLSDYIFFSPHMFTLAVIAAILLLVAPFLYFLYLGLRLLLRIQSPVKGLGAILLGMFIMGAILASISTINQVKQFATDENILDRQPQTDFESDTLYVSIASDYIWHDQINVHRLSPPEMMKIIDGDLYFANPYLRARPSESDVMVFEIDYEASGTSTTSALDHAENINYGYKLEGNRLILDPFFKVVGETKYRDQEVTFTIRIPEGKTIILEESTSRIINGYSGWANLRSYEIAGKSFKNIKREIICSSCPKEEEQDEEE